MPNHADNDPTGHDCLIIGGGPAGLTAAIYLARFLVSARVIDSGHSRAARIPLTRNLPGFPAGIAGHDLIARMHEQAAQYGVTITGGTVTRLVQTTGGFAVHADDRVFHVRAVLLATGAVNHPPPGMTARQHDLALASGRLRYCPICDGYEVTDRRVAVLGTGRRGCAEAAFLRSYTADLTLVAPPGGHRLSAAQRAELAEAGIALAGTCRGIALTDTAIELDVGDRALAFDSMYPALGLDSRSGLAAQLGAKLARDGSVVVDAHQRTSVAGLYAAGDVAKGLDQISRAMGEGGIAATAMRNDLARQAPLRF
jgi:thioredoxin reductase (NADPH)